jgi:aryl-alcohol dehydrogenase-like predicted oxidoreductase
VRWAIDASLRRLGADYVDVYQMHHPDETTPIAETLGVLGELVIEGKVRYVAVGGFSAEQVAGVAAASRAGDLPYPVYSMTHYSLLTWTFLTGAVDSQHGQHLPTDAPDTVDACMRLGIRIHPFFVLENGLLTGKFSRHGSPPAGSRMAARVGDVSAEVWDALDRLKAFADSHSVSMVDLAIGGIGAMPGVGVVIVGASTPEQVFANVKARDWTPTAGELEELLQLAAVPSA